MLEWIHDLGRCGEPGQHGKAIDFIGRLGSEGGPEPDLGAGGQIWNDRGAHRAGWPQGREEVAANSSRHSGGGAEIMRYQISFSRWALVVLEVIAPDENFPPGQRPLLSKFTGELVNRHYAQNPGIGKDVP